MGGKTLHKNVNITEYIAMVMLNKLLSHGR